MIDIEHRMAVAVEHLEDGQCRVTCARHEGDDPYTWTGPAEEVDQVIREHVGDAPEGPALAGPLGWKG